MIAAAVVITLLYVFVMLFLLYGFSKIPNFSGKNLAKKTHFSIVIPYRNEAENLPQLFESLLKLKYPPEMFDIIAVNDASEDNSAELWQNFQMENHGLQIKLLENIRKSGSPKKDAISLAISVAAYDYILTTDADCEVPPGWLGEFDAFIQETGAVAVAAPVMIKTEDPKMSFLTGFQELDFFSLQAATIGGFGVDHPFMCNGANFCYSKKAFLEVNGFEDNNKVASGDDVFLLQKLQKAGFKTALLKSAAATVRTLPATSWKQVFIQRVRWAAKASAYKDFFSRSIGILVFLMNLIVVAAGIMAVLHLVPVYLLLFCFLLKFNVDFYLIYHGARFFNRENVMRIYFVSSLFYPFFSTTVAFYSLFSGYNWKGRYFKK